MKKILFLTILVFGLLKLNAQVKYGPIIGIGYADNGYGKGVDLNLGGFVDFEFLDRFGFKPEINFASKTGWDTDNSGQAEVKTTATLKYIEIPLIVYFQVSPNLNMMLGPQFNSPLGGKVNQTADGGETVESTIDGHGGTGFMVGLEKSTFSQMKMGLRLTQFTADGGSDAGSSKILTIRFTVRYSFDW